MTHELRAALLAPLGLHQCFRCWRDIAQRLADSKRWRLRQTTRNLS